jgi:plastocyanin
MRTQRLLAALVAATALSWVALAVPGGAGVPSQKPPVVKVEVGDNFYKPKKVTVPAGTTIRWENEGNVNHNIIPNKGKKFTLKLMKPGKVYRFTFEDPGTYKYYCSFHGSPGTGQHGTIFVTEPPPPTTVPPAT